MTFATADDTIAETIEACVAGALPVCRKILASPPDHFPQLNTHTGRLTPAMMDRVLGRVAALPNGPRAGGTRRGSGRRPQRG